MEILVLVLLGLLLITLGLLIGKSRKTNATTTPAPLPVQTLAPARIDDNEPAFTPMPGWDTVVEDPPKVDWGQVLLHAAAIYLIQILLGLILGTTIAGMQQGQVIALLGLTNVLSMLVGLTIAGVLAHGDVGKHILFVGLLLWLFALSNIYLIGASFGQWFWGVTIIGLCALVAWGISKAIRGMRKRPA